MKRLLLSVVLLFNFISIIYPQNRSILRRMLLNRVEKNAAENIGPVPDYSNLAYWAASPFKHDFSDSTPLFLSDEERDSSADVFFIHPTTYISDISRSSWNADLRDTAVNNRTDLRPILYQATVFNGSCRVFAPRYRQAHLKAFLVLKSEEAKNALDTAYEDIKNAFMYYMAYYNNGRPIIIASHSQGSFLAIKLLKEFFDGTPLQNQLVCAYIVGYQIPKDSFKHLPVGNSPDATGCFVGWRSVRKGELPPIIKRENGNSICVNPLTWTTSDEWVPADSNKGGISKQFDKLIPNAAGAGIDPDANILWVEVSSAWGDKIEDVNNLHVLDYNLFWMNIRENVKVRINSFFAQLQANDN